MPAGFLKCYKNGGKIKTKKISKNRYMRICILNKKVYEGKIEKKKKN